MFLPGKADDTRVLEEPALHGAAPARDMRHVHSSQLNRQGNAYFSRGLCAEAYRCYADALEVDRTSGNPRALAVTLGNLGNICAVSGQRQQAERWYRDTLELQKTVGDDPGLSATLVNLGNVHVDAGEWERGRAYYLEALDMMEHCHMEHCHNDAAKAVLLSDLGLVAKETRQFEQALDYYSRSGTLMTRVGNHAGSADVFKMMARMYLAWERSDDAVACAQTSLAIAERLGDALRMGGAWYVLADCHEAEGRDAEAARYLARVVRVDRRYRLPKLEENTRRLQTLRQRLAGKVSRPQHRHESVENRRTP